MSIEALITPELARWARERRNFSREAIAKKMNVTEGAVEAWESGVGPRPTIRQARILADKLSVPLGYLYLSAPPTESLPIPDLRTVAGAPPRKPSPDFLEVLDDVLRKQHWYREYLKSEDAAPLEFIGRHIPEDDPEIIAADIRDTLDISDHVRRQSRSWESFLTELVRLAEGARILVLRSGIVGSNTHRTLDVEEFRGFAISDSLAPLVFINATDYKAAQIFTLAHELAHLWIGQSGVSNPDYALRSTQQQHAIDRQCDKIAAEVLVPREGFLERWSTRRPLDDNIQNLAVRYRVSAFVILRRAYELGRIDSDLYGDYYRELLERSRSRGTDDGGDFHKTLLSRNSSTLTTLLVVAAAEGRIPPREAASLLNIHMDTLSKVENRLLGTSSDNA
jgi:Zn-dependent peptidase ImmA (M78 family)/DNA-binding XRE family transcriptional regulator